MGLKQGWPRPPTSCIRPRTISLLSLLYHKILLCCIYVWLAAAGMQWYSCPLHTLQMVRFSHLAFWITSPHICNACRYEFIITARCSRRSSVLNLSDKPLLIPGWVGFWQIALSVPNGPSGSSMVPVDPQMAPDSPRESQTIIQVSEKFPSFTIFLSTIY